MEELAKSTCVFICYCLSRVKHQWVSLMIRVTTNLCVMPSPKLVVLMSSFTEKSTEKEVIESIMDIEDLVKNGNKHR